MPKKGIDREAQELFFTTFCKVKKEKDEELIRSLLSSAEIKDLARRLMAAKLLKQKHTYIEISNLMGMGQTTINKVYFKTKGSPIINELFT